MQRRRIREELCVLENTVVVGNEVLSSIWIHRVTNLHHERSDWGQKFGHDSGTQNGQKIPYGVLQLTRPVDALPSLLGKEETVAGAR